MQHTQTAHLARRLALLAGALLVLVAGLAPSAHAQAVDRQWRLSFPPSVPGQVVTPRTNTAFALFNQDKGDAVVHGERTYGINLVWSGTLKSEWRLSRASGTTGPVRYFERLALRNTTSGAYMKYTERKYGINLGWSSEPSYEWYIRGCCSGDVTTQSNLALVNTVENDSLVHGSRDYGIDLIWQHDPQRCSFGFLC